MIKQKTVKDLLDRFKKELKPLCLPKNNIAITGASSNSKKISKGFLFFALRGDNFHGAQFAQDAMDKGARTFIVEEPCPKKFKKALKKLSGNEQISILSAKDPANSISKISSWVYDYPSNAIKIIAVTGTNGKTTTTHILHSILKAAGKKTGILGTINHCIGTRIIPASLTTPQADEIQHLLHEMTASGITHCVMEVSSHALALGRVKDIEFTGAVFTNLTQDHLDHHKTMQRYYKTKASLFTKLLAQRKAQTFASVNLDDKWARQLFNEIKPIRSIKKSGYSIFALNSPLRAIRISQDSHKTGLRILANNKTIINIDFKLPGLFNIYNALAAMSCAMDLGIPVSRIKKGIERTAHVPGRLERVPNDSNLNVWIDYAHTPDALQNSLLTLKGIKRSGRLTAIIGCGGNRDKAKRPAMGRIAAQLADLAVFTSDNPRNESPRAITDQMKAGALRSGNTNFKIILDRAKAIKRVLADAQRNDTILIAGKGHEITQIMKNKAIPHDDKKVCLACLRKAS
ncbi:UDP-N-acetylmuramoyl-L-alanyl-D-glutamate--2,6-diaminopimelate ligase [Elusimicrobiota bacterium]